MKTKYGNARIYNGYYTITSSKEGNNGKRLHRLIFEDYHNCKLDESDVIHHIDGDPLNNHPANLICMSRKAHNILHNKNKQNPEHSERMSGDNNPMYNKNHSEENKMKMSEARNISGYYRVYKEKKKSCKQGYIWTYKYYEDHKYKTISSVDIKKLEEKVKAKGLKWREL